MLNLLSIAHFTTKKEKAVAKTNEEYPFEIPCPHANSAVPSSIAAKDHHPLSTQEIAELLDFARDHKGNGCAVAKVQIRLCQGIPGMTCPRPERNEAARRLARLTEIFMNRYEEGGTPDLVKAIESAMKG